MRIKNVVLCTLINYRKWIVDIKVYTIFSLIFVFSAWNFSGIREYASIVGVGVSPWIFPHILITPIAMPIYGCFTLLLFCDAPFIDRHMPFVIIRTGRISWVLGQLLYIVTTSIIYTVFNYLISILSFFPYFDFTHDWGKLIRTLAVNPTSAYEKGIDLTVWIDNSIITSFSAIKATLISLGLFFLVALFMGILIFCLNLITGKMTGVIVGGILVFLSYFTIYVGRITAGLKVYYFSPLNWSSLRYIDWYASGDSPSLLFAVIFLLSATLIMGLISVISFVRSDIEINQGME